MNILDIGGGFTGSEFQLKQVNALNDILMMRSDFDPLISVSKDTDKTC